MDAILPPAGLPGTSRAPAALALLPPAWDAGGMAISLAKFSALLTPKRRWAQFSVATMMIVVTVLCVWLAWRGRWRSPLAVLNETTEFDFTDQPFDSVVSYLKAKHKIEIELEDKALADAATIFPDSWEHLGGRGTIKFFPPTNCLIVSQSEKVHDELRKRLSP